MFYVFPKAVKRDTCEKIVKDCKQNILKKASILDYNEKSSIDNPDIRKTSVYFITERDNKINELVWGFLREANKIQFHYALEYFQAVQFAEYKNGGFYDWHQDGTGLDVSGEIRKLSLTLVLSDPDNFEGGELQFYNGGRSMEDIFGEMEGKRAKDDIKAQGTVIVFDSRDWHRITPVTRGIRHSIVCWTVGPNFR